MLTRILCENHSKLPDIVSRYFDGFTIIHALGFWKGKPESAAVIEIDMTNVDYNIPARINSVVSDIKYECKQESVLVQTIQTSSKLV
jgi:hypothetical protein